jgi:hypothetical protein
MGLLNDFSPGAAAITKSDATTYNPPIGVYVGTAGDVKIDTIEDRGTGIVVKAVAGAVLPWAVTKVYETGTTAAAMVSIKLP